MRLIRHTAIMAIIVFLLSVAFIPAYAGDATVNTCDFTTLEAAVTTANAGGGTITFNCSGTIYFPYHLTISASVIIDGNGNAVVFDGQNAVRHFSVTGGATLNLTGLTLQNGRQTLYGGSIFNDGSVILSYMTFINNPSAYGAIDNNGSVNVSNTSFTGGGIYNYFGTVSSSDTQFVNNSGYGLYNYNGTVNVQDTTFTNSVCIGTIADNGGNIKDVASTNCPGVILVALSASAACNGADLQVTINAGDGNFDITADSGTLQSNVTTGIYTFTGPRNETNVSVRELTGDGQSLNLGDFNCALPTSALTANATCIGTDLQVNIMTGDAYFEISADSGLLLGGASLNTHIIAGPLNETNVTVTEFGGDLQSLNLGDFNCFASSTLTATAVCNGADLEIVITNGNAPFTINVTNTAGVMSLGGMALGVHTFTGPDTFANITVIEEGGDLETLPLAGVTCTASIVPVEPAPVEAVVLSPDMNALGCELTNTVEMPNASDNTFCRVLMRDGEVVGYNGAIPADLINLGVIFAVDIYQLRGGQSVNEFAGYQQICLAGSGRLFFMDSRQAPRVLVELDVDNVNGFACGWIPAPGTLVLTK